MDAESIEGLLERERKATINRADAEAVQIKGLQKREKGDNKESGRIGFAGLQRREKGDNQESGRRDYADQGTAGEGEERQ